VLGGYTQEDPGRAMWLPPALRPVLEGSNADPEKGCKLRLRQSVLVPNSHDIRSLEFSIGTLESAYRSVDRYTEALLRKFLVRRHKVPGRGTRPFSNRYLYENLGLVRLQTSRRVSRSQAMA
jgi:hypothetical protein